MNNKPGANGNTGSDSVSKAQPDGFTLLLCDVASPAISPFFQCERSTWAKVVADGGVKLD